MKENNAAPNSDFLIRRRSLMFGGCSMLLAATGMGSSRASTPRSMSGSKAPRIEADRLAAKYMFHDGAIWRRNYGAAANWTRTDLPWRPFNEFLQAGEEEVAAAMVRAARWSSANGIYILFEGRYRLEETVLINHSNVRMIFSNADFMLEERRMKGILSNGASGPIGLHFKGCDNLQLVGAARFAGSGNDRSTRLAAMVFDRCTQTQTGDFKFEDMAIGRIVNWCSQGQFGDIEANNMKGLQPFGVGTAGSAEVIVGSRDCTFGRITARNNYKPVRYCSVAYDENKQAFDNQYCDFGPIEATAWDGSPESSILAVRSARHCTFDRIEGEGFNTGLLIGRYANDRGWTVSGNSFASVSGSFPATGASVGGAVVVSLERGIGIGENSIERVNASAFGPFGIFSNGGTLWISRADIFGNPARSLVFSNSEVNIGDFVVSGQKREAILYGRGARGSIGSLSIESGSSIPVRYAVRYDESLVSGSAPRLRIGAIRYRQNRIGNDYPRIRSE